MKSNLPFISIVMATYNGANYIEEQLNSIAAQTYQNFELIIQDDNSSDNTVEIIKKFSNKLSIKLAINHENLGYIKNFETTLKKAKGDFVALCDQDDIWVENKLEKLLENIGDNSLIYANSMLVDSEGKSLNKSLSDKLNNNFIHSHSPLNFLYDNCVSAHAVLFKSELLSTLFPFPKNLYFDAWIAANAAAQGGVRYLPENLVLYRQHANNTLSKNEKKQPSLIKKVSIKAGKKRVETENTILTLQDLLASTALNQHQRDLLEKLLNMEKDFEKTWFNLPLFSFLFRYRHLFFAITKKNSLLLCLKKAIGYKSYKLFPFL
jgi:glycosyltransferase involved in cell wall biosynthesis